MPYKDKRRYRDYMAEYMRDRRRIMQQAKRQMKADTEYIERLRQQFPTAYELLFGKKRRK